MGLSMGKTESPEKYYMDLAVQFKDRLDNLEMFAEALVKSTESQSNTIQFFLEEKVRKMSSAETLSQEDLPQAGHQQTAQSQIPGHLRPYGSSVDSFDASPAYLQINPQTRTGSGTPQRPKSSKNSKDTNPQSGAQSNSRNASSRQGRRLVQDSHSEAPGQPMDTSVPVESVDDSVAGRKAKMAAESDDRRNAHLLETLQNNQTSTCSMSRGILHAVNHLQTLIPEEISKQQRSRAHVRPENATYQIRLFEGAASKPVVPLLYKESETQTTLNRENIQKLIEDNRLAKNTIESLERIRKKQDEDIERLIRELESARSTQVRYQPSSQGSWYQQWHSKPARSQATVQIYCHRRSDKINDVNTELDGLLKSQFDTINCDLTCIPCENKGQLNKSAPVVVLCINTSRLGTDVSSSLEGLDRTEKIAVVILHHKDTHALPRQPSHKILTGPEYKSLGDIIDMAFLANKGIYTCDMNQNALSALQNFITSSR